MRCRNIRLLLVALLFLSRSAMGIAIPSEVKRTVAFLFIKGADGKLVPNGTAFWVGVPSESDPSRTFVYLVTARHVLTTNADDPSSPLHRSVFLRLDRRSGGTETVEVPVRTTGTDATVFFPSDSTIDIAVIPALPDPSVFDFKVVPLDQVTSEQAFRSMNISEGSEVFFVGLFLHHLGEHKNLPVVRFGRVALISDEKVDWNGVKTDLYLMETTSYGGNSGSPVFYLLGSDRVPGSITLGPPEVRLAGVMKGAFQWPQPLRVAQTSGTPYIASNMGIAAVVPSYALRNLLLSEPLARLRAPKPGT